MLVNELYKDNDISIESYLELNGVKDWKNYLHPSGKYIEPFGLYDNMRDIVQELKYQYLNGHKVFIIQDGDVDGVTSAFIMYDYMKRLNTNWNIKILLHEGKKRGLDDEEIMERIRKERPFLVIVPDAGSNNKQQAEELMDMGIGLIVLDHHDITDKIKYGYLVSNQVGNVDHNGSGCVVTHKFLQALDNEFDVHYSGDYIDLVALSIISDAMNVTSMQNREYLYWGMFKDRSCIKNPFLNKLFDRFIGDKEYTQKDISWSIVPKLNAVCRSKNQELKQKILLALMNRMDLDEVADLCEQAHKEQRDIVENTIKDNIDSIDKNNQVIIFSSEDIPRSYSGLIAGKLMNECDGKPCIVGKIKDGEFVGSLRSPIPLRNTLNECEYVDLAQGHEFACGIFLKENNIQPLQEYLNSLDLSYEPNITVLKSYTPKSIPSRLFPLFEPYRELWSNSGLPIPTFHFKNINITNQDVSIIGASKRVLKWKVGGVEFVKFNCLKEDKVNLKLGHYENDTFVSNEKKEKLSIEVIGTLGVNEWNGNKTNQVIIDKIEVKDREDMSLDDIF